MPLTPADVHNVAFSKPPIGKRGYNEDEVDAFLDLVENELTRLIEENADLRQRVAELDQELASARAGGGGVAADSVDPGYEPAARAGARTRSPSPRRSRCTQPAADLTGQRGPAAQGRARCSAWPRTPPTG